MGWVGHDRPETRLRHAGAQKFMIHRKIQRKFRRLALDALGHPEQQRPVLYLV
jgi:hypothetical protein